ncbi:flagellar filament capping protein FliD [Frigidibacter oleivorans]|uniref:flagellar filament capping protein FliD n=1 Tax=Frigidibacter oleivorans TaxID=2487129 RepID=UPI000F8F5DAD|nr:flagellar filament capping protein FliD [Frigidibacter oleivorans]
MSTSTDLLKSLNGNGSGLDLSGLAGTLATAETAPRLTALQTSLATDSIRLSALSGMRAQLDSLGSALVAAASNPVLSVTTGSSQIMPTVTDRAKLLEGATAIAVQSLASGQVLEFGGFASTGDRIAPGRLTIDFGSWDAAATGFTADGARGAATIEVTEGMTLADLATALSGVPGLSARALDKGNGSWSLGITGATGAASAIRLTAAASGTGAGEVALSAFDTTATNATRQVQAAADAHLTVDGLSVRRASNTVSDIVPGMTLTLAAATSATITVERDGAVAEDNLRSLVTALNGTLGLLRTLTARSPDQGEEEALSGVLSGDRKLGTLEQAIRGALAAPLAGFGDRPVFLAQLGVATARDGSLSVDAARLESAFAADPAAFDAVFGDLLDSLTPGLAVSGTPGAAFTPGEHRFRVDASGRATLDGHAATGTLLKDGSTRWTVTGGPGEGLTLTTGAGVTSGTIRFGRSLVASLAAVLDGATSGDGTLARREDEIAAATAEAQARIEALEARAALIEKRYLTRFAAMEQAITRMNSTGSYLQNLVDLWSKSD